MQFLFFTVWVRMVNPRDWGFRENTLKIGKVWGGWSTSFFIAPFQDFGVFRNTVGDLFEVGRYKPTFENGSKKAYCNFSCNTAYIMIGTVLTKNEVGRKIAIFKKWLFLTNLVYICL